MKKIKVLTFLMAILCTSLISCSSDDDNSEDVSIVGTWKFVHSKGWEMDMGKKESWDKTLDGKEYWVFKADGYSYDYEEGETDNDNEFQ